MNKLATLEPQIKLSIVSIGEDGDKVMFGPGVAELCRGVRDLGSLNAAAKSMRMAYSKAWRIMGETEEALGMPLIIRDGARGSVLTDDGTTLLDAYDSLKADLHRYAALKYAEAVAD
ncbi:MULTISPECIES: winged helix-turn-helix domain-containing protein [unclassified Adlercreutzia]|uniref:winged helix-turn-helix domain-containing protein n=1 Tax=unclassified Adlercreutzia TaxID=2636013 RepID=UPI0013EAEE56|nr:MULTISPECIES: LysR family transcriptional regulator [unclassified Adlercreutzia]